MTLTEILPELKTLNRSEKMRVVKILIDEIAEEDEVFLENGASYPVWSPFDSFDAAEKLNQLLKQEKQSA